MIFVRILALIFQGIFSKTVKPQAHEARKHNKFTNHKAANPQSMFPKILARRNARKRLNKELIDPGPSENRVLPILDAFRTDFD